eukprot:Hpha_TRINITY_DN11465_c0_g1::TRINITY_DN11465_c0_g1_i1::g.137606::m.137606
MDMGAVCSQPEAFGQSPLQFRSRTERAATASTSTEVLTREAASESTIATPLSPIPVEVENTVSLTFTPLRFGGSRGAEEESSDSVSISPPAFPSGAAEVGPVWKAASEFMALGVKGTVGQTAEGVAAVGELLAGFTYNSFGATHDVTKKRRVGALLLTAQEIAQRSTTAQCVEAAFVALMLTQRFPLLTRFGLSFTSRLTQDGPEGEAGRVYKHIVLGVRLRRRFGALGISRAGGLMSKPLAFGSLAELVAAFAEVYHREGHEVIAVKVGRHIPTTSLAATPQWRGVKFRCEAGYSQATQTMSTQLSRFEAAALSENIAPLSPEACTAMAWTLDPASWASPPPPPQPPLQPQGARRRATSAPCRRGAPVQRSAGGITQITQCAAPLAPNSAQTRSRSGAPSARRSIPPRAVPAPALPPLPATTPGRRPAAAEPVSARSARRPSLHQSPSLSSIGRLSMPKPVTPPSSTPRPSRPERRPRSSLGNCKTRRGSRTPGTRSYRRD